MNNYAAARKRRETVKETEEDEDDMASDYQHMDDHEEHVLKINVETH
jgi:hypothetical protein